MTIRFSLALIVCIGGFSSVAGAQQPYNVTTSIPNLATLFTRLYGPDGLIVDSLATLPGEQPHSAHFVSDFQSDFGQFSTALVGQLVTVPLPSPASGFTYRFDPSLGVFERTTQSFGPVLAERTQTVGAGRISFGSAWQRVTFDTIEGLDLDRVPVVFTHDNAELLGGREDVVATVNSIAATVSQFTTFLTVGVTDRFDVSIAVPIVSNRIQVVSDATIHRLGTTNPLTHFFRQSDDSIGSRRLFTVFGDASGLGDVTVRLKGTLTELSPNVAAGLDIRLPTGDELNLLGTGAPGLQPFIVWSTAIEQVSPHVNAGYQWNGSSVLAGNPATGEAGDFHDQVTYAMGADVRVNSRFTLALDVLGRYVRDGERLAPEEFLGLDGESTFSNVAFSTGSFHVLSGSVGFKANLLAQLLLDVNVLFALDDHGLRDQITPLIGVEYAF
jgi:hypothetical protein